VVTFVDVPSWVVWIGALFGAANIAIVIVRYVAWKRENG
jgi:hypothetical protein